MKIISWNLNGIKARIEDGSFEKIFKEEPDIICFQEVKSAEIPEIEGYHSYLFPSGNGVNYSGVAVYTKIKPISFKYGFNKKKFDIEGRVLKLEFENFNLYNIYSPTGGGSDEDFEFKTEFYDNLTDYIEKSNKSVVVCGDFNRISQVIDAKNVENIIGKSGFKPNEREWFREILTKYIDAFRKFNDDTDKFTWWPYGWDARAKNNGYRFDYFLVSNSFKNMLKDSYILTDHMGSDHAPIVLELNSCPSCGFVNHLSNENCSYCGNKLIDDEEEEFDYEEKLEIPKDKIILLDLNFTLIANSEDIKGLSLDEKIKAQEYELELIDLIKDNYVILITASPYNLSHKILRDIKEKTGFEPNESYWNFRRQPPALKEYWMKNEVLPMHGDNPEQYLAIESNSRTRKMYGELGIEAKPKQYFINIKK